MLYVCQDLYPGGSSSFSPNGLGELSMFMLLVAFKLLGKFNAFIQGGLFEIFANRYSIIEYEHLSIKIHNAYFSYV